MAKRPKRELLPDEPAQTYVGSGHYERWWNATKEDAWKSVFATVLSIEDRQISRKHNWNNYRAFYENKGTNSPASDGRIPLVWNDGRLTLNVIRSCIQTVAAKISQEKPRAFFLTSHADFGLQQKAEKLTRCIDGVFTATRQYEVSQDAFLDSCVYGTGAMRLFIDGEEASGKYKDDRKPCSERVLITELVVDDREAVYGKPLQIHHKRLVSKDVLCAQYPESEAAIRLAPSYIIEGGQTGGLNTASSDDCNMVEVIESWHLRSSKRKDDGRHSLCVQGENGTIFFEEYEKDYLPFVFLHWSRPLSGFWGTGLAEELLGVQKEVNRLLRDIHSAQKNAVPTIFIEKFSDVNQDHFDNNPIGRIIQYKGSPPIFTTPAAMNAEMYNHLERLYAKAFEIAGVSQLSAGGKKPAGLDAAVALREFQDIETGRFVLQGQRYETAHIDVAKIFVDMMKDIYEGNPELKVKARAKFGKKFLATIKWEEVDLEEDQYEMDVFPVSQLPRTPAARKQMITELMQQQDENGKPLLSGAMALQLLNFPDLEEYTDLKTAGLNVIRMHIDKMMTGDDYIPPLPFMDLATAVEIGQMSILLATLNEVPELAIENLQRYVNACIDLMPTSSGTTPPSADAVAPPGAPPPDAGMMPPPGMPPGPPPMAPMGLPPPGMPPPPSPIGMA